MTDEQRAKIKAATDGYREERATRDRVQAERDRANALRALPQADRKTIEHCLQVALLSFQETRAALSKHAVEGVDDRTMQEFARYIDRTQELIEVME